jgi:hypothetical protein
MNEVNGTTFLAAAHTLELRTVGHGLHALGLRIEGIEHQAADLRALAAFLAARPAHREPEHVAPVRREAA